MQAYNKEATYNFLSSYVVSKIIEIAFVLWGQFVLGASLPLRAIMGIAIGAGIGSIVSDVINEFMGMFFLASAEANGLQAKPARRPGPRCGG